MSDKSYVTLERRVCYACGIAYDTGNLLLDTRLRKTFDRYTVTGFGLCPEDQKLYEQGYVALVEVDPEKSKTRDGQIQPEDAYRTGRVVHMRVSAFERVFHALPRNAEDKTPPAVFVDPTIMNYVEQLRSQAT